MPLFDLFWAMLFFALGVSWIVLLIKVFADLFRSDMSGGFKALWVFLLVLLPFLGVLIYLVGRGGDTTQRSLEESKSADMARYQM